MKQTENICGTCVWHRRECKDGWICGNINSDCGGAYTDYTDSCDDWKGKDDERIYNPRQARGAE